MSHFTPRVSAFLALVFTPLLAVDGAEAGVGVMSGGSLSSVGHFAPVQTVQSDGCWYDNGWNGPGYYPCGNEWNSRPDAAGAVAPIIIPALRGIIAMRSSLRIPTRGTRSIPWRRSPAHGPGLRSLPALQGSVVLAPQAFICLIPAPARRQSLPVLPVAECITASAGAIFIICTV